MSFTSKITWSQFQQNLIVLKILENHNFSKNKSKILNKNIKITFIFLTAKNNVRALVDLAWENREIGCKLYPTVYNLKVQVINFKRICIYIFFVFTHWKIEILF